MLKKIVILNSVGSAIDSSGNVYPLNADGTPDTFDGGVPLSDCSDEWRNALSADDAAVLEEQR